MQFVLHITLDNAEVEEAGIDVALPGYLAQAAARCASGSADAGIVFDGNGNRIGAYRTTDDNEPEYGRLHAYVREVASVIPGALGSDRLAAGAMRALSKSASALLGDDCASGRHSHADPFAGIPGARGEADRKF